MLVRAQRIVLLFGCLLALSGMAHAGSCEKPVGRLVSLQGLVEARAPDQAAWRIARLDDSFCAGDALRTGARSRAALVLANETIVRLDQLTTLTLSGLDDPVTSWVDLLSGVAHFLSRTPRALKVKTPYVNAGIEGTEFVVRADRDEGSITVLEGRVLAENTQGSIHITSGESATARAGLAPMTRLVARPRDAVEWSLYYPPLFDPGALTGALWTESARRSADAYLAGDSASAFAALDAVPVTITDARFFNYRAGLFLSVGRADEAQADIARALSLAAENAHAHALQAVVALARNDNPLALELARSANARDPESVPAWIALSYAQQAMFDLEGARTSVEQALSRDPRNVLVLARLSELWLSVGDLERALETAQRAVALSPNIARTQAVLGFAYLTQIKVTEAKQAFGKAIALDSTDPLPRLGLGLATIRTGQLEAGRREIEIAAALDPNNALIRSYLGKAYYEEKRNRLASAQFDMAKMLDPKDPTPWFYDAIRKQTENRPVEALEDVQKSIELNDNRAVYRSRLLLDQDLSMRGDSLARIHRDLGLNPVAQAEAARSITLDPANHSAHRFLSDSYVGRPRYEIARSSELLQSQLLQPVGMNPIQPQSAETNLNVLSSAGPREASFNEFTPLFARNDIQVTASALAGNHSTVGDELAISGLQNRISYSLGQFYYKTDGFRENNDVEHNIFTAFTQVQVAQGVDVQMEFRRRKTDQGDLRLVFDPAFVPTDRRTLDQDVARVGVHIAPSPHSDVVASLVSSTYQEGFNRVEPFQTLTGTKDAKGYDAQLQYLFRSTAVSGVVGAGWYEVESDDLLLLSTSVPFPMVIPLADGVFRTKQQNGYVYLNVPLGGRITTTLGVSYDSVSSEETNLDINKFSPKLGLQWDATPGLRLRAAAFDTTKRTLLINQTIEPTQVAGFNQFFDDLDGTRAHSLAFAVDMVHKRGLYSGLEARRRRLEVPNVAAGNIIEDRRDDEYRAYLYWVPHPRWSYSVDYRLEALRGEFPDADPTKVDTTSIPVGIRYFHPYGAFASLITTYVRQEVGYTYSAPPSAELKKEDFTVVDLAAGYRFPRRMGSLSVEVKNLFKRDFLYQDNSFVTADQFNYSPRYIPDRSVFVKALLNF